MSPGVGGAGGCAGWNTIGPLERVRRLGTLLGPEETPVGVFLVAVPGWWSNASGVGVVAAGGWGSVVC